MTLDPHDAAAAAVPETPLQQALRDGDAAALLAAHRSRLQALRADCAARLAAGLARADYGLWQERLRMCDAALRVLDRLQAAPAAPLSLGPAATLPAWPSLAA